MRSSKTGMSIWTVWRSLYEYCPLPCLFANIGMTKLNRSWWAIRPWITSNSLSSDFLHVWNVDEGFGGSSGDNHVTQAMSSFGQGISDPNADVMRIFCHCKWWGNVGFSLSVRSTTASMKLLVNHKEIVGNPVPASSVAWQTRNYMITVGTDPQFWYPSIHRISHIQVARS